MANAPAQVAQAPAQAGAAVPAVKPVAQANPLEKLEKIFGPIGDPRLRAATAEAASTTAPMDQLANGMRQAGQVADVSAWSQIMSQTGGLPDPSKPNFAERQKAGMELFRRMQQQKSTVPQGNSFIPAGDAYMGGGPAVTGQQALAAGGQELSGYGGTLISAETVAGQRQSLTSGRPDTTGSHNRFILRQNPNTVPAEGSFMPPRTPATPSQSTPTEDPYQQSLQRYDSTMAAAMEPKDTDRYTRTGPMSRDGKYIGDGAFDKRTGRTGIMVNGELQPLPEGTEPITATGLQKSIPDQKQFRNLKGELTDAEISLRNMDRYMKSVGGSAQGVKRLATQFVTGLKTLVGQGLNLQEIATKMAQGQMQGLLGANRTNVVGGGVMTEQDALRIIQRLGGDVNALQNPEIVRRAIGEVYSDRYAQYQDSLKFYNSAVGEYYGSKGFKPAEEVKFSESFKFEEPEPEAAAKPSKGLTDEQRKRKEALIKKRDAARAQNK